MPNKHAAIKDLRKNKKRASHNLRIKQNVRVLFKKSKELVAKGPSAEAKASVLAYQQAIDKAAKAGVVSKNKAGHKKSSLMKGLLVKA